MNQYEYEKWPLLDSDAFWEADSTETEVNTHSNDSAKKSLSNLRFCNR